MSTVDRTDFANDTAAAVAKGPLTYEIYAAGGFSNANYGYQLGGSPGAGGSSKVSRMIFLMMEQML